MTATTGRTLRHHAMFYDRDDEFTTVLSAFLRTGLTRGDAAVVASTPANIVLLRDALGDQAGEVTFLDRDDWYRRPTTTVAGWQRLLDQAIAEGRPGVSIVGEVGFGPPDRHVGWTRYESALNAVFTQAPAEIVCPYDVRALPSAVLADACRTHATVLDPQPVGSDRYQPPDQLLRQLPDPALRPIGTPALAATFADVAGLRRQVRTLVHTVGWLADDRLDDLLLVLSEMASNSLRHGAGRPSLHLWGAPGEIVCEIRDQGTGPDDPLAGYRPPDPNMEGSRGLWIARQVCDDFAISADEAGTRVTFAIRTS
ncbi:anti-sigma factor RsbA family regulatory protein [Micromonospora coerulea]|uniref:anti-sigma factor RsbA family regulatory protein n=1 Tax=Micromonospora coerulea TaxID=47856 RepID=UPI0019081A4B|nr:anti-sigma factor RsbA family regulatory protein [Micromonospora veneta]